MSTIVAICPYCRAGGVRAPKSALGAVATCPKCKSNFTVIQSENVPANWDDEAGPKPAPVTETRAMAAMPDVTEPSPVLTAGEAKKPRRKPKPVAEPLPDVPERDYSTPRPDLATVCALGALILVGPTVLASQLPFGRFIAAVLALTGLVGGLACLGAEGQTRKFAAGAAVLHFLTLVVVVFLPGWLNLDPWVPPAKPEEPKGPLAVEHATNATAPVSPSDWLDAAKYAWQLGDARVTVRSAVGPVELHGPKDAKRTTKEQYLFLTLQVRNMGFDREIPLSAWAAGQGAEGVRVTDAAGKPLAPAAFEPGWAPAPGKPIGRAVPGQTPEVTLLFAAPPAKTDFVRVQLSGAAVGAPDEIKFRTGVVGVLPRGPVP
ncbi:MAG: hypothetical protein J0I06_07120 [Planctomycetes bacterium]|nr:hypothetical protein [Planctomycetota bacterium]